jgi:hypothetical protein
VNAAVALAWGANYVALVVLAWRNGWEPPSVASVRDAAVEDAVWFGVCGGSLVAATGILVGSFAAVVAGWVVWTAGIIVWHDRQARQAAALRDAIEVSRNDAIAAAVRAEVAVLRRHLSASTDHLVRQLDAAIDEITDTH